jgi:glyoxylase-like metal-dependent hydrolase (beta-lactamase superfamily II)
MNPIVKEFFDPATSTLTYLAFEKEGSPCVIIDSVLDYDPKSGRTKTKSADEVISFVKSKNLQVEWILETHAHADHLTAAPYLKKNLGGKIAIGSRIEAVQKVFKGVFNLEDDFATDGSQFDRLLEDGEVVNIGNLKCETIAVPGHTPACVAYKIGDTIFTGDTMFMPDIGSARCDFPGGDARMLFRSIKKILNYPDETRLFVCHDYPPSGRNVEFMTRVSEQKKNNIHLRDGITEEQFVEMRTKRDANLEMPALILPAIQINIRGGDAPPKENNGTAYLKIPLNAV